MRRRIRKLKVRDWVEVRSKEEILQTLDDNGCLDGMPFMPEMFAVCGMRFQVYKRAHKTCDTVFPTRSRRVDRAVHLDTRCDGSAHGGCQAGCLIFWKEAWLKPCGSDFTGNLSAVSKISGCEEAKVWSGAQAPESGGHVLRYVCQATQLPYATTDLAWWDIRQYIEDYRSGNVGLRRILSGLMYSMYYDLSQAGIGLGPAMRWLYDKLHPLWAGPPWPRKPGMIPDGHATPGSDLNLQPGELVRIKAHADILKTVTTTNKNRGMHWDAELVPYCGGTYRVLRRVTKIIDEKTGMMVEMKTPCIILDGVVCQSRYSGRRMFCPRSIYSYWREIWLERAESGCSGKVDGEQNLARAQHQEWEP